MFVIVPRMKLILLLILSFFSYSAFAEDFVLQSQAKVEGAPSVKLILNEEYMIAHAIFKGNQFIADDPDMYAFQVIAWKIDQDAFNSLTDYRESSPEAFSSDEFKKKYEGFFSKLKKSSEYTVLKEQVIKYMSESIKEWDLNLPLTTSFMKYYSGFAFDHEANVYITHPYWGNGRMHNAQKKIISFGATPDFKNYFTVYIWHEILHFHMPITHESHVVNQLLTDNDLRVYLGGGDLLPLKGHDNLIPAMTRSLPAWQEYKKNPTNLNEFALTVSYP